MHPAACSLRVPGRDHGSALLKDILMSEKPKRRIPAPCSNVPADTDTGADMRRAWFRAFMSKRGLTPTTLARKLGFSTPQLVLQLPPRMV